MKKKIFGLIMAATLAMTSLAGCNNNSGGGDSTPADNTEKTEQTQEASSGDKQKLEFYHGYYHDESEWAPAKVMRDLYDAFAAAHADGPVEFVPIAVENRGEITQNMIAGGQFPDVTDLAGDEIPLAAISGNLILDLKPYIDENDLQDQVGINYVQNDFGGKIYSVHEQLLTRGIWYNEDVLAEAGCDETDLETWEGFANIVASVGDGNYAYIAGQSSVQLMTAVLATNGGDDMITSDLTADIIESEEFADAFLTVAALDQANGSEHTTNDVGNMMDDFNKNGNVAVLHNGVWNASGIGEGLEDAIQPALFPENVSILQAGGGITISSSLTPEQEELALAFLEYMTSEEVQEVIFTEVQANPCNTNVDIVALAAASGDPVVEKLALACDLCNNADIAVPGISWGGDVSAAIINAFMECAVSGADIEARFEALKKELISIIG